MPQAPSRLDTTGSKKVRGGFGARLDGRRPLERYCCRPSRGAERRIRAAACFWFLSGIRIGAFVTLPLSAVDLDNLTVKQWPKLGVKTKFSKHATTFLSGIPKLLEVARAWDKEVRSICGNTGLWFALSLSP